MNGELWRYFWRKSSRRWTKFACFWRARSGHAGTSSCPRSRTYDSVSFVYDLSVLTLSSHYFLPFISRFSLFCLITFHLRTQGVNWFFLPFLFVAFRFGLTSKFDVEFQQGLSAKVRSVAFDRSSGHVFRTRMVALQGNLIATLNIVFVLLVFLPFNMLLLIEMLKSKDSVSTYLAESIFFPHIFLQSFFSRRLSRYTLFITTTPWRAKSWSLVL